MYQTVEGLRASGAIIFETVTGSHAYGTNTPKSDVDLRGLFILPQSWHLGIKPVPEEVAIEKQDTKYFELKKFVTLAADVNPNIIELLWPPDDCNRVVKWPYEMLRENRRIFLSRKALHTFSGYAYSQIKKAKGQNKMVHQDAKWEPGILWIRQMLKEGDASSEWVEKKYGSLVAKAILRGQDFISTLTEEEMDAVAAVSPDTAALVRPHHRDFCWVILKQSFTHEEWNKILAAKSFPSWPARPLHISRVGINLDRFHVAALEHTRDVYRLYDYGDDGKGVFRGDDLLVCEPIPVDHEWEKFSGMLIYNTDAYKDACSDWERYWTWRANRNEARWAAETGEKFEFDAKNLMHCMRLLWSGENLLVQGEPIVRFSGEKLEMLRKIRAGDMPYEQIMEMVESKMAALGPLADASPLPQKVDLDRINHLYLEIVHRWETEAAK